MGILLFFLFFCSMFGGCVFVCLCVWGFVVVFVWCNLWGWGGGCVCVCMRVVAFVIAYVYENIVSVNMFETVSVTHLTLPTNRSV